MVERESHIILPKKDKIRILPRCDLRIEPNGIEKIDKNSAPTKNTSLIYEDYCFDKLLRDHPQDFIIGPRLIDYMGDVCHFSLFNSTGRTRPDALILSTNLNITYASGIVECKSGNNPDLWQKADGFQDLANAINDGPGEIHKGLRLAIGEQADLLPIHSQNIRVLGDKLKVIFMTNFEAEEIQKPYPNLEFEYIKYQIFVRDMTNNHLVLIPTS